MGIASDLRQSVLQEAMQGKLTTQKAEDGDARELLLEIRAEKEKLVKEKKIKKEKPLAPVTDDEIPFDIPDNWVWCRLSDIFNINTGLAFTKGDKCNASTEEEIIRVLRGGNILDNYHYKIDSSDVFVPRSKYAAKCISLNAGDIITPAVTSMDKMCKAAIIDQDLESITAGGFVYIIKEVDKKKLLPKYALYFWSSETNKNLCKPSIHKSGQAFYNLKKSSLMNQIFPLPPLPEQQRIVARVEALMKEIDQLEQTEKELEAIKAAFPADMKASLLQAAMEGKLTTQKAEDGDAKDLLLSIREEKEKLVKEKKKKKEKPLAPITDEEIPFDIPENWVWCRLNDITVKEIRRGKSPKYSDVQRNTLSFAQKCNTKYDGIQMSLAKYLDESTLKRYTEEDAIIDGDTIINSTGHGTLGRVGFFTDSNNPNHLTIYPDSHVTVVRPSRNCDSRFIHLYIKTQQSWFETKGEGSTNQTELKPAVIKSIVIPLPPLSEQQRIVEKLDQLLPLCDSLSEH